MLKISIMLFLKNSSIKKYWFSSNRELLLYLSNSLAEKVTHNVHNIAYEADGLKYLSGGTLFSKSKMKICDFSVFAMSHTATFF